MNGLDIMACGGYHRLPGAALPWLAQYATIPEHGKIKQGFKRKKGRGEKHRTRLKATVVYSTL